MEWMEKALSELEHHPNTAMTKAARKMHNSFFD